MKELKLSKGKVFTINGESKVFDALTIMQSHGLSSLPMVDPQGHLLGSVSLSDVIYFY